MAEENSTIFPDCNKDVNGCTVYYDDCNELFGRLTVLPSIRGGTRVEWNLNTGFSDPGSYLFTLQVSYAGIKDESAWRDVESVRDTYFLIDPEQRVYGTIQLVYYRVKLETESGTYYSKPEHTFGALNYSQWALYRAVIKEEKLQQTKNGIPGWLFKHKIVHGVPCKRCLNRQTQETMDPNCPECLGVGYEGGYYDPVECYYITLEPKQYNQNRNMDGPGMSNLIQQDGRAIAQPMPTAYDIWVNMKNDDRYFIHEIKVESEQLGVPMILRLTLRLIPYSNKLYRQLKVPGTMPDYYN